MYIVTKICSNFPGLHFHLHLHFPVRHHAIPLKGVHAHKSYVGGALGNVRQSLVNWNQGVRLKAYSKIVCCVFNGTQCRWANATKNCWVMKNIRLICFAKISEKLCSLQFFGGSYF